MRKVCATFVLPAENGCNLKCKGCIIDQKREADIHLQSSDYIRFLRDALFHFRVERVSLQGHEVLLPDAWPLTVDMLSLATAYLCDTSLVTNGTFLALHAAELENILGSITISLDSADPAFHDAHRNQGIPGAHAQTVEGIRVALPYFGDRLAVGSILFAESNASLQGMPDLLASLGVRRWFVSPFINAKLERHTPQADFIRATMLELHKKCAPLGITLILSDEANRLAITEHDIPGVEINRLDESTPLFRLSPNGRCTRLDQAMGSSQKEALWDKITSPHQFLGRIFEEIGYILERRNRVEKFFSPFAWITFKYLRYLKNLQVRVSRGKQHPNNRLDPMINILDGKKPPRSLYSRFRRLYKLLFGL